ncbi:MAG: hypothetical protein GY696_11585 [Gammaproteobacteria bacterium]|nr:hypothetical protein [Gammaproteobacteria bacterium]
MPPPNDTRPPKLPLDGTGSPMPPPGGSGQPKPPYGETEPPIPPPDGTGQPPKPHTDGTGSPLSGGTGSPKPPLAGTRRPMPPDGTAPHKHPMERTGSPFRPPGGTGPPKPLLGGTGQSTAPVEGTGPPKLPLDGTGSPMPQQDGTGQPKPPQGRTEPPMPTPDGTGPSKPPLDGAGSPKPRPDGTGHSKPPQEGTEPPILPPEVSVSPMPLTYGTPPATSLCQLYGLKSSCTFATSDESFLDGGFLIGGGRRYAAPECSGGVCTVHHGITTVIYGSKISTNLCNGRGDILGFFGNSIQEPNQLGMWAYHGKSNLMTGTCHNTIPAAQRDNVVFNNLRSEIALQCTDGVLKAVFSSQIGAGPAALTEIYCFTEINCHSTKACTP